MSSKTPARVRGKRNAVMGQKWNHGKKRNGDQLRSRTSSRSSSVFSDATGASVRSRERRRLDADLSRLEQLPTEVLQTIFLFAKNLVLPFASSHILSQLQSKHLYFEITSRIMYHVTKARQSSEDDLKLASRLMNSNFFTWEFLQAWLHDTHKRLQTDLTVAEWIEEPTARGWNMLTPNSRLLPPKKLLRAPFTAEKVEMLDCLSFCYGYSGHLDPLYAELVRDAWEEAVTSTDSEIAIRMTAVCAKLKLEFDNELLRIAVIDGHCNRQVVEQILEQVENDLEFEYLDPAIWAWAERACADANEDGAWLKDRLSEEQGRVSEERIW